MSYPPNLVLLSPSLATDRRDFTLSDPTVLNPIGTNPLVDGEWLEFNPDNSGNVYRGTGTGGTNPAWAVFAERGRYDTQAIQKTPLLFLGMYHAQTTIYNTTSIIVGSPLMVTNVTIGGLTKRGLALATGSAMIVAWATQLIGSGASQVLQFVANQGFNYL